MLLALALYVYDATILLQSNEFLLVERAGRRWLPLFGSNLWKLAGKEPVVPAVLMPWRAVVKVRWDFEQGLSGAQNAGADLLPALGWGPKVAVTLVMLLVFVALPACLFVYPVTALTVFVGVMIYVCCAATMLAIGLQREALGLSRTGFWKLVAEGITCPPFCINAVRKASLGAQTRVTAADVAARLGAGEPMEALKHAMGVRVGEQMDIEPEGSMRLRRLEQTALALRGTDTP
jgi:hypothetical protein